MSENGRMARPRKTPETLRPAWAVRLEAARTMTGFGQTDFARRIGLSQQRYSNYEYGLREPDIATWILLKHALNVSLDFLLAGEPPARLAEDAPANRLKAV
jgi:transcriptional regulator with XRE-family HTH domain